MHRLVSHPAFAGAVAFVLTSFPAEADTVTTTLRGSFIDTVTAGGVTVPADQLLTGQSTGVTSFLGGQNFPTLAADNLNLATHFARSGVASPNWDVDLGVWFDTNGAGPDFFLFELGGGDTVTVRPLLVGGGVGQATVVAGWTPTGYAPTTGPNKGQQVFGLSFRITDLKDATGAALTNANALAGVRLSSANIDGASFSAVHPNPVLGPIPSQRFRIFLNSVPRVWHPFEVLVKGPFFDELDGPPNPFLDARLQVAFTGPSGQTYDVPGFYAGDGRGGAKGEIWKVRFAPDEAGTWQLAVSFRVGKQVAVDLAPNAGTPAGLDGKGETFTVQPADPNASGFLKWGRLEYVGGHYAKFVDGPYFLKGGIDSPENFLACFAFDDPQDAGNLGILHHYPSHAADWQVGDPLFVSNTSGEDSKAIIGALNYLASEGVNSIYAILMNLGGDSQDAFPFLGASGTFFENLHYDISKLEQWNTVFEHAQRLGIMVHLVFGETEPQNEMWLSNGTLGVERKLYYREMVARFGHLLAVKWNISEENDFSVNTLATFADFIASQDPYDHPVCAHTHLDSFAFYNQIYGDARYSASSMQYSQDNAGSFVETLRSQSAAAGRPWIVDMDENGPAATGLTNANANDLRKRILWDVYLSGGQVEWYCGANPLPLGGDQDLEDFRTRQAMWGYMRHARTFLETYAPFWQMQPMDNLLTGENGAFGGGEVFAKPGDTYVVYVPQATSTGSLNLTATSGAFTQRWFNPRTGQFNGTPKSINGGAFVALGAPPHSTGEDWVVLIER